MKQLLVNLQELIGDILFVVFFTLSLFIVGFVGLFMVLDLIFPIGIAVFLNFLFYSWLISNVWRRVW